MRRLHVRIKRHGDTVTISGIPAEFAHHIFIAASLQQYDADKRHEEKAAEVAKKVANNEYGLGECIQENYDSGGAWLKMRRRIIDCVVKTPRYDHGYNNIPVTQLDDLGRWCRFREVRQVREDRLRIARIMEGIGRGD